MGDVVVRRFGRAAAVELYVESARLPRSEVLWAALLDEGPSVASLVLADKVMPELTAYWYVVRVYFRWRPAAKVVIRSKRVAEAVERVTGGRGRIARAETMSDGSLLIEVAKADEG